MCHEGIAFADVVRLSAKGRTVGKQDEILRPCGAPDHHCVSDGAAGHLGVLRSGCGIREQDRRAVRFCDARVRIGWRRGGGTAGVQRLAQHPGRDTGTRGRALAWAGQCGRDGPVWCTWLLRRPKPEESSTLAVTLSVLGAGLALVTGWLGGELVDRLGVGVDNGAHLDAPNSLNDGQTSANAEQE